MASIKRLKDPKPLQKQEVYNSQGLDEYDATYWLANITLSSMGARVTPLDNKYARFFENILFWFIMTNLLLATALESINMTLSACEGNMMDVFSMMPCVGYLLVAISKAYKIKSCKPVYQNLVKELREMWPVGQITEEEHQITEDNLKSLRNVTKVYFISNLTLASMYVLPACIIFIKKWSGVEVQRQLFFFFWFPFDPLQDTIYEIVVAFQSFQCYTSVGFMLSGDLLFFNFLGNITTQFTLLTLKVNKMICVKTDDQLIESYPLGAFSKEQLSINKDLDLNNVEINNNVEKKLVEVIHHHQVLIRLKLEYNLVTFLTLTYRLPVKTIAAKPSKRRVKIKILSEDVENMYSFSLLVNFINSSIIICFCLFCVTFVEEWNAITYKIFLMTAILQIWILCWYGQKLLDTSAGLGDALYNSGWYILSNKLKKTILIMIHRSQKEVYITTFGFSIVSLASYGTILKTSWSYFTLLINMYEE